jgi:nucleoside-diphosphate-sugar epimerase
MTDLYIKTLEYPDELIHRKIFNAGYHNMKMKDIAATVKKVVEEKLDCQNLQIVTTTMDDNRSYRVSSEKIKKELGFEAKRSVEMAVADLCDAFSAGKIPNSLEDKRYFNIKTMQAINFK